MSSAAILRRRIEANLANRCPLANIGKFGRYFFDGEAALSGKLTNVKSARLLSGPVPLLFIGAPARHLS
jgi:hypothetical protein